MRVLWLTDIHLNLLDDDQVFKFLHSLSKSDCESIWISGDIAEADSISDYLLLMQDVLCKPIHFVLGNHDFYKGSIRKVRNRITDLCQQNRHLRWLPDMETVEISPDAALLGHDSWADGRLGSYTGSNLLLSDYLLIEEFNPWIAEAKQSDLAIEGGMIAYMERLDGPEARKKRLQTMQALAQEAVSYLQKNLVKALDHYQHVYFLTHAPPFKDACLYHGQPSSDYGLPHFSSKVVGDTLVEIMKDYPGKKLTVLCGHTHSLAFVQPISNLTVHAGSATYGAPDIQMSIEVN
jgi:Icc protein